MLGLLHALRRLVREPRFTLAAAGTLGVAALHTEPRDVLTE